MSETPPAALFRRKKEFKRGITYSIMLLGKAGTGKVTFANNLLESSLFPHQYEPPRSHQQGQLNERITVTHPTTPVSFNSNNGLPTFDAEFTPETANLDKGITITSTSVEISTNEDPHAGGSSDDTILLNLVITHDIENNLDNTMCFNEITTYLEQQFDYVLAEETRIKRNPRFEDTRVHVALYFIEPNGHGLNELDIELMKRVSRYTNVLPIICKADSLTQDELVKFKQILLLDFQRFNIPIFKFELDPNDDDLDAIEENENLAKLQPFAIICSDERDPQTGKYIRNYPWGKIDNVNNEKISDLLILKNVLFGSHLQEFKDTTQNLLYENYRAEKLSSVTKSAASTSASTGPESNENDTSRISAVPSLSNFTSLINTGQFKSSPSIALNNINNDSAPTTPRLNNNPDDSVSPIKQMSIEIKHENEEIINSIKKDAQTPDITERNKLRNISETIPYVLRHERIIAKQQKLEELEAQSAKELQKRIQELEKKAQELKLREKLLKSKKLTVTSSSNSINSSSQIKKNDTYTDLASIVSHDQASM